MKLSIPCGLAAFLFCAAAPAFDYLSGPAPNESGVYSTAQINSKISGGYRPTSIDFYTNSGGLKLAASLVGNSGTFHRPTIFRSAQTQSSLQTLIQQGWQIVDIEWYPTGVGNNRSLAAILSKNVPTSSAFWGWTEAQVTAHLGTTRRLIDLDVDLISGVGYRYSGVSIANSGANASAWGYHFSTTIANANTWINANGMRIIDAASRPDGKYTMVYRKAKAGERTWTLLSKLQPIIQVYGKTEGYYLQAVSVRGTTWCGVYVNNLNADTLPVFNYMRGRTNGNIGIFLKPVGTSLSLAEMRSYDKFHPSSSIKALIGFHVARNNPANTLNTRLITVGGVPIVLPNVVRAMMRQSDNPSSNALVNTFGRANINATAHNVLNMSSNTQLVNTFGSGGPYGNDQITYTTLRDMGILWENIAQGGLLTATRRTWYTNNILSHADNGMLAAAVNEMAATLGKSNTIRTTVINGRQLLYKAGNNSDPDTGVNGYLSLCGIATLPYRQNGVTGIRRYVFGVWVHGATTNTVSLNEASKLLLRAAAKNALQSF